MSVSVRFGQTDQFQIAVWIEVRKEGKNRLSRRRHAALQSTKNALFTLPHLAHLLTIKARKTAVSPSLTIKNRSKTMERHEKPSMISGHEKTLESQRFFDDFDSCSAVQQALISSRNHQKTLESQRFQGFFMPGNL